MNNNNKLFIILVLVFLMGFIAHCGQSAFENFSLKDYINGDWSIERSTQIYREGQLAEKKEIFGQLNFTTSPVPLQENVDVEEGFTLASYLSYSNVVDPLHISQSEEEEETNEEGEEVRFDILDNTSGKLTLNNTSYELTFLPLQGNMAGSISQNLKFFFVNKNQFLIIEKKETDGSIVENVWVANRIVETKPTTFFQRYGPMITIFIVLFGSRIFQRAVPQGPAPAAAATGGARQ
jgi:hypothetical protein